MNILDATRTFMLLGGQSFRINMDDAETRRMRVKILAEEYNEYVSGETAGDLIEIADGLADVIVVAFGTLLTYFGDDGTKAILEEVAQSNLSKVDGSLGPILRREDGKIQKPPGWKPPDIEGALRRAGFIA